MDPAFCSYCGARAAATRCASCGADLRRHPLAVTVVVVPVDDGQRRGVLVVRRAVPPGVGKLALVSGFLEAHEPWQVGAAREVREETGVVLDPERLEPLWFASATHRPRILVFALAAVIDAGALPVHADVETLERGLVYGPEGLDQVFVYPHHVDVVGRYFASLGIGGPHGFLRR